MIAVCVIPGFWECTTYGRHFLWNLEKWW